MSTSPIESVPAVTLGWRLRMAIEHGQRMDRLGTKAREEIAEHLGVSKATITRWTHDEGAGPRKTEIRAWAELCGVSADWLETGHVPGPKHPVGGSDSLRKLTDAKRSRSHRRVAKSPNQPYGLRRAA